MAEFFRKYKISVTDDVDLFQDVELGSILSDKNDKVNLFELTNIIVDGKEDVYEFTSTLKREELLEK